MSFSITLDNNANKVVKQIVKHATANAAVVTFTDDTKALASLDTKKGYFIVQGNQAVPTFCQPNGMLNADIKFSKMDNGDVWLTKSTQSAKLL